MKTAIATPENPSRIIIICKNNDAYTASVCKSVKNFNCFEFPIQINQSKKLYSKDIELIILLNSNSNEIKVWNKKGFSSFHLTHEKESDLKAIFQKKEDDKQ